MAGGVKEQEKSKPIYKSNIVTHNCKSTEFMKTNMERATHYNLRSSIATNQKLGNKSKIPRGVALITKKVVQKNGGVTKRTTKNSNINQG